MEKLYYAYVAENVIDRFNEKLAEHKDKIKVISAVPTFSSKAEPIMAVMLLAEEGLINPEWMLGK